MKTGIYQIRHLTHHKRYIGSAAGQKGFEHRWGSHLSDLNLGQHDNSYLQRAWDKYGEESFIFEVIEYIVRLDEMTDEEWRTLVLQREQYYLDVFLFASCNDQRFKQLGYNILRVAGSSLGYRHSDETKIKMSQSASGKNHVNFGKNLTQECRMKISEALKGNKNSQGVVRSEKERRRISQLHKGKIVSLDTRNKLRLANAKLTIEQVRQIRHMLILGYTQQKIAEIFNMSKKAISKIKLGQTWGNVK